MSCGDATEVLDAAEEALDAVSLLVESRVAGVLTPSMSAVRCDRVASLRDDFPIEPISVIGLVAQDVLSGQTLDQITSRGYVILLARPQDDANR